MINYNQEPLKYYLAGTVSIADFVNTGDAANIDTKTVESFGEEWTKFSSFDKAEIERMGNEYFDILHHSNVNKESIALDVGCGTGRWSYYLSPRVKFIEAIDPSNAVSSAIELTKECENIRVTKAEVNNIPFPNNSFDLVFSLGVLHHVPDTEAAIKNIFRKVKPGGYFLVYLYYKFDNRGIVFKTVFMLSSLLRRIVSATPKEIKHFLSEIIAFTIYLPLVLLARFLKWVFPRSSFYKKIPLSYYHNKSMTIIRNDALDRFGTPLEKRFTRSEINALLTNAGFVDIIFSDETPYWHCIARKPI